MKNKLRRRCRRCEKRVNLRIIRIKNIPYIKCPNCLGTAKYIKQEYYENMKKSAE